MAQPDLLIELDCEVENGPLVSYMSSYNAEEFETYVTGAASDSRRRAIVFENIEFQSFVKKAFEGTNAEIDVKIADIEPIIAKRKPSTDLLAEHPDFSRLNKSNDFGHRLKQQRRANYSGPEFAELARVAISHGAWGAGGAALGAVLIKAAKDVIVKWLDGQGKKKVKISLGSGRSLKITGPVNETKFKELTALLQETLAADAAAKAATKSKPRAAKKPKT